MDILSGGRETEDGNGSYILPQVSFPSSSAAALFVLYISLVVLPVKLIELDPP